MIEGFYYVENFLTDDEHEKLLKDVRQSNDFKNVGMSFRSRKALHYGYEYSYNGTAIKKLKEDIPLLYKNLVDLERINTAIGNNLLKQKMEQLIINEYLPGQGIGPHTDHVKFFGPIIICITIGSGCEIEFRNKTGDEKIIYVKPKSIYIMSGESRYSWTHAIKPKKDDNGIERSTRYSLTFRTINK